MAPPGKNPSQFRPPPGARPEARPVPAPAKAPAASSGPTETGWLPDCVYTGEKFETGLAFFADGLGRISRFSREPADLASARRLAGQAALPGLVNAHSHAYHRLLRGRGETRVRAGADPLANWREAHDRVATRLTGEDLYAAARLAFLEMVLAGITCVGEFHGLHQPVDGAAPSDPNFLSQEILRAARDVGIRIGLLKAASAPSAHPRMVVASADQFVREAEALRSFAAKEYPADEVWIGLAAQSVAGVPADYLKAIGAYAHAQRMRFQVHLPVAAEENLAVVREAGRPALALLAELGLVDKRLTAIGGAHLTDDDCKLLGSARALVCAVPTTQQNFGWPALPVEKLLAAGVGIALGSDSQVQVDLFEEARGLELPLRVESRRRAVLAPEAATLLFHAATVSGARSLGATGGALEVGRPADFFTVNLLDPALAGADPASLLSHLMFAFDRRCVHEVWIGARQCLSNGRHPHQGAIVSRFADVQKRLWTGS